jgi:hypothetical protein
MTQTELVAPEVTPIGHFDIGRGFVLHLPLGPRRQGDLYFQTNIIKRVNLADKSELRFFVVELWQKDLNQTRVAEAIYTLQETAIETVLPNSPVQNTTPLPEPTETSSTPELSLPTTVAEELTVLDASHTNVSAIVAIPDNNPDTNQSDTVTPSTSTANEKVSKIPYADNHGWEVNRYAGIFTMIMVLVAYSHWLLRIFRLFGDGWRIFMVFVFMAVSNIRSMEQIKHHRQDELGRLLGLKRLPALDTHVDMVSCHSRFTPIQDIARRVFCPSNTQRSGQYPILVY